MSTESLEIMSTVTEPDTDAPDAPRACDECDNTEFVPHWLPTSVDANRQDSEYAFAYHSCSDCGMVYNDRRDKFPSNATDREAPSWRELFGHPTPYDHQEDAIEHVIQTGSAGGYSVVEGGCGCGKTMIALTAGLRLVRDPNTKYERILVLTSVKQQLRQFEDDLRIINQNLPDGIPPATAVTLVGKTDLCPYAREDVGGVTTGNVNGRCRQLRDSTSDLMSGKDGMSGAMLAENVGRPEGTWESAGETSPYGEYMPEAQGQEYCPFYANYKEHNDPLFSFGHADDCILTPEEIVSLGMENGVCPHSAMGVLCKDADVVVANYYHAFDNNTLNITGDLLDEGTLLVCDEAHMLEPRVRGIMSREASFNAINKALDEVARTLLPVTDGLIDGNDLVGRPPSPQEVDVALAKNGLSAAAAENMYKFLNGFGQLIDNAVETHLDNTHPGWKRDSDPLPPRIEVPLRDPETEEPDTVTEWAEENGVPEYIWENLPLLAKAVSDALETVDETTVDYAIEEVAELLNNWYERDHEKYFREITLFERSDSTGPVSDWQSRYSADVQLHSVMPRSLIGNRLDTFGGGLLMSATIEPIDVYQDVVGLQGIAEFNGRKVTERTYRVEFPEENRYSAVVDLEEFTYENRGDITDETDTRNRYEQAITEVCRTSKGNALVCMPSYREGEWAADIIRDDPTIDKEVLVDKSSSEDETKLLKQEFFDGPPKVLVTSLRGTLTEGVDYDGDKLTACVVCGVPIENVDSPKTQAVRSAYQQKYGYKDGFDYSLAVPAVRKARQALGRVIRGKEDVGVRVLVDRRYCYSPDDNRGTQSCVRQYLSDLERDEYGVLQSVDQLSNELESFWAQH